MLEKEAAEAATRGVPIPPAHRRYIEWSETAARDITADLAKGRAQLCFGARSPQPAKLAIVDRRRPAPRARLVVERADGTRVGAEREISLDYTWSSHELVEHVRGSAAAGELPASPLAVLLDGHRSFPPLLLNSPVANGPGPIVLRAQPAPNMQIHIQNASGKATSHWVHPQFTVCELKAQHQEREGIPTTLQRLIDTADKRQLEDGRALGLYNIRADDVIFMALRLRGGKPVICVWATQPTHVRVRLALSARWSFSSLVPRPDRCDRPLLPLGGRTAEWRLTAQPDGTLLHPASGGRAYSYLFWEALTTTDARDEAATGPGGTTLVASTGNDGAGAIPGLGPTPCGLPLPDFDSGRSFCVAGAEVEAWMYDALAAFGLPVRERTDFLTYWLPHMEGAAWLLLSFADPRDYQAAAALAVEPAPDVLVRLFMLFERLAAPVAVGGSLEAEVARVGALRREGAALAVLEWGGMEVVRGGRG